MPPDRFYACLMRILEGSFSAPPGCGRTRADSRSACAGSRSAAEASLNPCATHSAGCSGTEPIPGPVARALAACRSEDRSRASVLGRLARSLPNSRHRKSAKRFEWRPAVATDDGRVRDCAGGDLGSCTVWQPVPGLRVRVVDLVRGSRRTCLDHAESVLRLARGVGMRRSGMPTWTGRLGPTSVM